MTRTRTSTTLLLTCALALALLWPADMQAQGRSRGGGGRSGRAVAVPRAPYARPYYIPPYYYPRHYGVPFSYSFWWGFSPYGFYPTFPYGFGFPVYPYGGFYDPAGTARTLVTPKQTQVYVNGFLAGTVDDFDGVFQGLRLPPGGHEIVLYLDGHQSVKEQIHLSPGSTYKLRHTMVPLPAGTPPAARPVPPPRDPAAARRAGPPPPRMSPSRNDEAATLSIRVQPPDAEILIDGQPWESQPERDRLDVAVSEGRHIVEVRQEGYQPFVTTVHVRPGETKTLNISLSDGTTKP